jgi:excisionase family DNA binding protein
MTDKSVEHLEKKAFTAKEIAYMTNTHINTIRLLLRKKVIGSIKISRKYLVSRSNLDAWLDGK